MKETQTDLDLHVFVCTNQKANKECCAQKGAEDLRHELKDWAKSNPDWKKRIRINASGCLDHCKDGIAIALYPEGKLLLNVDAGDADRVKKIIAEMMA